MIIVDYKTYYAARHGVRLDINWNDATAMFASPKALAPVGICPTTDEESDEYKEWKAVVDKYKKDNGYVFWGDTVDGRKGAKDIINHSAVCLDYDGVKNGDRFLEHVEKVLEHTNYMYYSTTKSTQDLLRLRIIIPFNEKSAVGDEYQAIARQFIKLIGTDGIDKTSFEDNRAMGYTVLLKGQQYVYKAVTDKDFLDKDEFLKQESLDWQDASTWFYLPEETEEERTLTKRATASRAKDEFVAPTELKGYVGAFCRAFSISKAMEKFLPDVYTPAGANRYTYKYGSTTGGVVTFDDRGVKSYHSTDPARWARNAFELVMAHLYGSDAQAKKKMIELAKSDKDVIAEKNRLRPVEIEIPDFAENWLDFFEYPANDWGIAKRMLDLYKGRIGWATDARWWLVYDGIKWKDIDVSILYGYFELIASIMRALSANVKGAEDVNTISTIVNYCQTSRYRDSILKALKPMVQLLKGEMDSDDHGMNMTTGYLRLNDDKNYLVANSPDFHCRKQCGGGFTEDFKPDEECLNFLKTTIPQEDLYHWLHKWFGYCLTGSTVEKKMVFLYGKRNNGKSALITLAKEAMGDYQCVGDENMLLNTKFGASDGDSPTPSVVRLNGVRLCLIDEMPAGRKLNGSAVKRMTHGVGLKGRDLCQSTIEFRFRGKIVVACNDIPSMGDAWDSALRMRIRICPFTQIFDSKTADKSIEDKILTKSWKDTFLWWCFEGLQYYKAEGLDDYTGDNLEDSNMPALMKSALKDYFRDSDEIGDFLETYCEVTGNNEDFVPFVILYDMYVSEQKMSFSVSKKMFSQLVGRYMEEHGCKKGRKYCTGINAGGGSVYGGGSRQGSQQHGYFGIRFID